VLIGHWTWTTQQVGNRKFNNEWFGRNQWLTASIAKQSLACYSVEWLCGTKSGIKGLFNKVKMINIQHWPCCQWSMICAKLKTTVNLELRNLTLVIFRQLGTGEKRAPTGEMRFERSSNSELYIWNSGLFQEPQPEDHWCHHDSTLFFQSSQLSSNHHKSRECQTLMTKFHDKSCPQEGLLRHLSIQVSTQQSKNVLYAAA
jgi:hypothetical protein